jgi:hypothetical protein
LEGASFTVGISENEMLIDEEYLGHKICRLPFYSMKTTITKRWIVGNRIMRDYYTVFNVSDSDPSFMIAIKDPTF